MYKFLIILLLQVSIESLGQDTIKLSNKMAKSKFGLAMGLNDSKKIGEKNSNYQFGYKLGLLNSIRFSKNVFLTSQLSVIYDRSKISNGLIFSLNNGSLEFEEQNYWVALPIQLNIIPFKSFKQFFVGAGFAPRILLKSDAALSYTVINNGLAETVTGGYSLLSRRSKSNLFLTLQVGYCVKTCYSHKVFVSVSIERNLLPMVHIAPNSIVISYLDPDYKLLTASLNVSYLL
jgi:hypothetical protein